MQRALAILVFVTLAVTLVPTSVAQYDPVLGRPGGLGWFGDEPNVMSPGTLPYANHASDDVVLGYPADANGLAAALAGEPTLVLAARYYAGSQAYVANYHDVNEILAPFLERDFLVGAGQFLAWHGTWADLNGDGYLTHRGLSARPIYVDGSPGRTCAGQELRTDDDEGLVVQYAPLGIRHETGISYRCTDADEWAAAAATEVVGYVTPYVPTLSLFGTQGRDPDLDFAGPGGAEGGRYYSPKSNWDHAFVDNSILETTVVEVMVGAALSPDGPRSKVAGPQTLVDVDLYRSVDPLLESAYQSALALVAGEGCDVDHPENNLLFNDCPRSVTELLEDGPPAPDLDAVVDPAIGETWAMHFPGLENKRAGRPDYSDGPHVYLDLRVQYSSYWAVAASANDFPLFRFSHTGSGEEEGPLYAGVYGRLGVWNDRNGDGWVGAPAATDGCPNVYDCGATPDPNEWGSTTGPAAEWTPSCRKERRHGEILGELTSSTGDWGRGVYVLTDRRYAPPVYTHDEYERDGRIGFNPWDDAAWDLSDGNVDHLVTAGPIEVRNVCGLGGPGVYRSYEHFVFLSSNLGFDVTFRTEVVEVDFRDAGVEEIEAISDEHVVRSWSL